MPRRRALLLAVLTLAAALRAIHLDAPILGEHAWRQADTAAMARNFDEGGLDLLHPRIDWGGVTSGALESEFPLYPFAVALLYRGLGPDEAWARALSLLLSLIAIAYLHALARATTDDATALWAAGFLAILPLSVHFGRAVMPEPLMLAASVGGVFHFLIWTRSGRSRHLIASALLISTACAVKLPCLYLAVPLLQLAWCRFGARALLRPALWAYAAATLAPVLLWYAHAHEIFLETGLTVGIWDPADKFGSVALVTSAEYWDRIVWVRFAHRLLTWPGFALFAIGLCLPRRSREEWVFDAWLAGFAVSLVVVARGHYAHNYYQLPLLFPAVVFMAKPLARWLHAPASRVPLRVALAGLVAGVVGTGFAHQRELLAKEDPSTSPVMTLAEHLAAASEPEDLVVVTDADPTLLYLAHRKGWRVPLPDLSDATLGQLRVSGAAFVLGTREHRNWSDAEESRLVELGNAHELLWSDTCCFLIRLRGP